MSKRTDNYSFETKQAMARRRVATVCLKYMHRNKLSEVQFANLIRLSVGQLKNILNKENNTTLNVLVKISEVTGENLI